MSADAIAPALTGFPAPSLPWEVTGLTANGDLAPTPCPRLGWDSANAEESLTTVFARVSKTADDAITWYLKAKQPKKSYARAVRGGSIFLAALAGILPML